MIARSALPFTLRNILGRVGFASAQQRGVGAGGRCLNLWQCMFAALGVWSAESQLAWRSEIRLFDEPEKFRRFCPDCRGDTEHEGFDEFGAGWYAQICRAVHAARHESLASGLVVNTTKVPLSDACGRRLRKPSGVSIQGVYNVLSINKPT
jgi:hypothetical protein